MSDESNEARQAPALPGLLVFLVFVVVAGVLSGAAIGLAVADPEPSVLPSPSEAPGGGDGADGGGGDVAAGEAIYKSTCAACHGANAEGGIGLPLAGSEFVASTSVDDLVAFIKAGRPADDPANQTGTAMPPNGGNPSLTDEDLAAVASYIKSLNS